MRKSLLLLACGIILVAPSWSASGPVGISSARAGEDLLTAQTQVPAAPPEAAQKTRTPSPAKAAVYFIDLKDGDHVPANVNIRVGLRNMGVAPAGVVFPDTGHHHVIVDSDLPPFDQEIPADLNHIHFGAGETEMVIQLTPGEHTLQLLLADQNHIPHDPPVFSSRIRVFVDGATSAAAVQTAPAKPVRARAPPDAAVYFIYPRDGEVVPPTSLMRFGLRNMGVAPAGVTRANTGHHHLLIDIGTPPPDEEIPSDYNHLHLGAGETEASVTLPPGKHTLQLEFADGNHLPFDPPVVSKRITVTVRAARKKAP